MDGPQSLSGDIPDGPEQASGTPKPLTCADSAEGKQMNV